MTQRETPNELADKLIEMSGLSDGMRLLEPSCGNGKILTRLRNNFEFKNLYIIAVELNKELAQQAFEIKGENNLPFTNGIIHADFLKHDFGEQKFDRIIAAPPFKNNIDVVHITKMYELLAKKGVMVSLTTPFWLTNNETHQVEFRKFLEGKDYYLKMLPDNTFMEKGKTVPTATLKIFKK